VQRSVVNGRPIAIRDDRSPEQIREHYELERRLAMRLRNSTGEERARLYAECYGELYRSLPHHPMVARGSSPFDRAIHARPALRTLRPFLRRASVMVEIGPGDCGVSIGAAGQLVRVFAVDVSDESAVRDDKWPENLDYVEFDGLHVPLPDGCCDLAFSNQVIEHLHPDDAAAQLREIRRLLGGRGRGEFVCVVPNRTTGPYDISQHFDDVATGFHLNEVTTGQLVRVLREAGFGHIRSVLRVGDIVVTYPPILNRLLEAVVGQLPQRWRRAIGLHPLGHKAGLANVTLSARG
jgi:SAM-dependent methyltransferase